MAGVSFRIGGRYIEMFWLKTKSTVGFYYWNALWHFFSQRPSPRQWFIDGARCFDRVSLIATTPRDMADCEHNYPHVKPFKHVTDVLHSFWYPFSSSLLMVRVAVMLLLLSHFPNEPFQWGSWIDDALLFTPLRIPIIFVYLLAF